MNLEKLCTEVIGIVKDAGQFIAGERQKFRLDAVEKKGKSDFVSYVDKGAEKQLVEKLHQILPEAGFITEENTAGSQGETLKWIIDPLDGTTNFIHGIPPYAVSVALAEGNEIILGVIYEVTQDECFYAWKDSQAYLNGKVIRVSDAGTTEDSLIATGFPYYNFEKLGGYMEAMNYFIQQSQGIRRLGSAATDLAYVAAGRFEAFWEHALHAWDVAAGVLIIKQAGGRVTDFNGGDNFLFGGEIVAANGAYFREFYDIVHQHLGN